MSKKKSSTVVQKHSDAAVTNWSKYIGGKLPLPPADIFLAAKTNFRTEYDEVAIKNLEERFGVGVEKITIKLSDIDEEETFAMQSRLEEQIIPSTVNEILYGSANGTCLYLPALVVEKFVRDGKTRYRILDGRNRFVDAKLVEAVTIKAYLVKNATPQQLKRIRHTFNNLMNGRRHSTSEHERHLETDLFEVLDNKSAWPCLAASFSVSMDRLNEVAKAIRVKLALAAEGKLGTIGTLKSSMVAKLGEMKDVNLIERVGKLAAGLDASEDTVKEAVQSAKNVIGNGVMSKTVIDKAGDAAENAIRVRSSSAGRSKLRTKNNQWHSFTLKIGSAENLLNILNNAETYQTMQELFPVEEHHKFPIIAAMLENLGKLALKRAKEIS